MMAKENRFYVREAQGNPLTKGRCTVYVDRETGIEYLFVQVGYSGGLTPLLNTDGTPRVVVGPERSAH